ncbi:MAG: hypothetical protein LBR36_03145 [Bacteroidales bacterium]|jgi:hypothetical protein|nr:hypothetical protein [Bacteroidales bacterium]
MELGKWDTRKWTKDNLAAAIEKDEENTGKLIQLFTQTDQLEIELVEFYPCVKRLFFQYKEGEILLEFINKDTITTECVEVYRIMSYFVKKGILKILLDLTLRYYKSCEFQALRQSNANGDYSMLRLANDFQIDVHHLSHDRMVFLYDYEYEKEVKDKQVLEQIRNSTPQTILKILNNDLTCRQIWKDHGFTWSGKAYPLKKE